MCLASGAIAEPPAPGVIPDFATAVAVDRSDDAVVTGLHMRRPGAEPGCDFFAAKLRHDTGVVAWRTQFPDCEIDEALGPANGEQVFLDAGGDVVVAKRVPPRAFPPRRPRDVPRRTKSMAQAHHWT